MVASVSYTVLVAENFEDDLEDSWGKSVCSGSARSRLRLRPSTRFARSVIPRSCVIREASGKGTIATRTLLVSARRLSHTLYVPIFNVVVALLVGAPCQCGVRYVLHSDPLPQAATPVEDVIEVQADWNHRVHVSPSSSLSPLKAY